MQTLSVTCHITDDDLERLLLGPVTDEDDNATLEGPLLVCEECISRADKDRHCVQTTRRAGAVWLLSGFRRRLGPVPRLSLQILGCNGLFQRQMVAPGLTDQSQTPENGGWQVYNTSRSQDPAIGILPARLRGLK